MLTFQHTIPLHQAIMVFDTKHVKKLLKEQCDINETNNKGECAVTLCMHQNAFEILEILLFGQDYQEVNINVQDSLGYWVIPRSKQFGYLKIYDLINKAAEKKQQERLWREAHFFQLIKNHDFETKEEVIDQFRPLNK